MEIEKIIDDLCLIVENKATSYRKEQAFKRIKELR